MMFQRTLLLITFLYCMHAPLQAQEWPRFRGPNGSGVGQGPKNFKDFAWKVPLRGIGHSSPVLWQNRVFVTGGDEAGTRIVQCLDAKSGKELWHRDRPGKKHGIHKDNSFASSTPALTGRHLVLCWAGPSEFLVEALDHTGKELWHVDLGAFKARYGLGASPIIHDDLVVVPNEQDGQSKLVGLELATGKVRWEVKRRSRSHYATPCVYQPAGGSAQLIFTSYEHGITSVDPATGKVNWELDVFDKGHVESSIASPIISGDTILATCGWLGVRQEIVAVRLRDGKPRPSEPILYKVDKPAPLVPTPIVNDGLLFSWNDRGVVSCIDLASGKEYWRERVPGNYYSSPVCANGRLCCVSREGDLIVVAAAKEFGVVATIPLGEGSHSTPSLGGTKMVVRTFRQLMCVGE